MVTRKMNAPAPHELCTCRSAGPIQPAGSELVTSIGETFSGSRFPETRLSLCSRGIAQFRFPALFFFALCRALPARIGSENFLNGAGRIFFHRCLSSAALPLPVRIGSENLKWRRTKCEPVHKIYRGFCGSVSDSLSA